MDDAQATVLRHHDIIWSQGNVDACEIIFTAIVIEGLVPEHLCASRQIELIPGQATRIIVRAGQ